MLKDDYNLEFNTLHDNGEMIVFEIPSEQTKLKAAEQLDELKRPDELFFPCQHAIVDEKSVKLYFKRNHMYQNVQTLSNATIDLKINIIRNVSNLNRLVGTQFTTTLHPKNVYVNEQGDIKLVHRGIRHALPPNEFNEKQLLKEMKELAVYLFTGYSPYLAENQALETRDESFITKLNQAHTLKEIEFIIQNSELKVDKEITESNNLNVSEPKKEKVKKRGKHISLLSGMLLGFLCGLIFLYVTQIIPLTDTSSEMESSFSEKEKELNKEKEELNNLLSESNKLNEAYRLSFIGETEEAISVLELMDTLPEEGEELLTSLYLGSDNPDSLVKAIEIDKEHYKTVINKLVALNNVEANNKLLSFETDDPNITIEQAWINKDYEGVIDRYEQIKDSDRAKWLAARSYLEVNEPEKALALGEELEDLSIQKSSVEKLIELIESDESIDSSKKKKRLDGLIKQLEELEK
ncbi:type VII secretion protein EssB/YukC [Paucisalibacillus sp. EB02]|uniref:type VII secretion protein EssB/YukC n=1 Tax=Paucisalibacillus sp. EB02 TaxID=1347087 RepID=UPI0005A89967|nr:type VII secretion protein EssB/YukC [Paucisalibacillus sp. EB02]